MNVIEIPQTDHSILGPSSAKRWINCPGSVLATKDVPHEPSPYAAEGSVAHYVAELCRLNGTDAKEHLGRQFSCEGFTFTCDEEMVDSVNEFCEYVADFDGIHIFETRVTFDEWVPGGFGRSDHAALSNVCHVFDLKYGKGVQVYAQGNEQGMMYALGILHDFGWMYDFEKFVIHICQPRLDHWDRWEIGARDLQQWAARVLRPAARKALEPSAAFAAGEWCQFCKIKATCKVRAEMVFSTVQGESGFDDLDASSPRIIPMLTNDEVALALKQRDNIEKWCADLTKYAMAEIRSGRPVGDWKIVEGGSKRRFKEDKSGLVSKLKEAGLIETDIWETKIRTPAQIEKKLKKQKGIIADYVEKPPGKPMLASGDDPREAISADALSGFDNLDADEQE